jgi:hypothetical protein
MSDAERSTASSLSQWLFGQLPRAYEGLADKPCLFGQYTVQATGRNDAEHSKLASTSRTKQRATGKAVRIHCIQIKNLIRGFSKDNYTDASPSQRHRIAVIYFSSTGAGTLAA